MKKILIIEDEKTLSKALALKLTLSGFAVTTAFDGESGVAFLLKETFALILLDLVMPKMGGFEVLAILKEKNILTPVMVLSNLSQESDLRRAKEFGAKEFFIKSNTPLMTIVGHVIQILK